MGGGFNWVDVRDVCQGAIAAEQSGARGERYILAGHHLPVVDLAQLIRESAGIEAPSVCLPMWIGRAAAPFVALGGLVTRKAPLFTLASLHALENHQRVTHEKASRELGYSPRPIRETVEDTIAWFRQVGRI